MSITSQDRILLYISKARNATLDNLQQGTGIVSTTGRTISDLQSQAAADRIDLAEQFLAVADRLVRARPPMFRVAVGRYYYAMYHSMRAVVFYVESGDDHEDHSRLPTKTPQDFIQHAYWQNELKDARLRRNEADYDPYPAQDFDFKAQALHVRKQSHLLIVQARQYLRTKGCVYL